MLGFLRSFLIRHAPDNLFIFLVNMNNKFKGRPGVLRRYDSHIYTVDDGVRAVYTPRRSRLGRYFFGIGKQCSSLSQDYLLDNIEFREGDVVVDCGANNGEIGMWARSKGMDYFAFEPEPLEARCCDLNNYEGEEKTIRKGLWYEKTTLHWHSKPESADSSIIETPDAEEVVSIDTTTLNDFLNEEGIEHVRLLKLEAEGAEPEVLQGALKVLDKIDYIAVDCGYERGLEKKHTFMEVYDTLSAHNFKIVGAKFRRVVFLFKSDSIS